MKRANCLLALVLIFAILLTACGGGVEESFTPVSDVTPGTIPEDISSADLNGMDFNFTDRDKNESIDEENAKTPTEDSINITTEGTYVISGDIVSLVVDTPDSAKVTLVFDGVNINNPQGPAVYIASADKVFINLKEGSENSVSDGAGYSYSPDEGADGAIFSRADLTINGSGTLKVEGNNQHGIVSKDDLVIVSAKLDIKSQNVGLNGKDCVKISNADIKIDAGSDGIRSDNDEDANRGYIYVEDGKIDITSGNDGFQAETALRIDNGEFNLVCGGGSKTALSGNESHKGLKAVSDIVIYNGSFNVDSKDDAIHSNNTICIHDGNFTLSSGDDGIHADTDLAIANCKMKISKSYEGLESSRVFISGGEIDITASDDGLNAAGGNDSSATTGGRPGMGAFSNGIGEILISGGYVLVNASGDGIDSNGTITLTGGIVLVSGPTNSGNGAFDYDKSATVKGGILIALGSSGMAQNFSAAENQGAILTSFSTQNGGTSFALCDSEGKVIVSFTPPKAYQSAVVSAPEIQKDGKYSIVCGGSVANADKNGFTHNSDISGGTKLTDITMTDLIYGSGGMGPGGGGGMGPGGGGGMRPDGGARPPRP